MERIEAGHYKMGIYHVRRINSACWQVTVEDGKGFPFAPMRFDRLRDVRLWLGA